MAFPPTHRRAADQGLGGGRGGPAHSGGRGSAASSVDPGPAQ